MNGMISIIVPIYNVSKYLDKCITSIINQSYRNLQIILVDDGSTDKSLAICKSYQKRDDRINIIHQNNQGLVSARKAGIKVAVGEYVGYVDGDDWIEPQMYEHLMNWAVKYQVDMVLGGYMEDVDGHTVNKINQFRSGVYDKERLSEEIYPYMLCGEKFFSMGIQPFIWNKLLRREFAQEYVMIVDDRIRVGEDVAAVMPMLLNADKIVISDYCDYHYCIRRTSMMQQQENVEREWDKLCILHRFLRNAFSVYQNQYQIDNQLNHYTIMNMLTRAYEKVAKREEEEVIWPFNYRLGTRKCVIYGAGNFGRAVYGYLREHYQGMFSWVDQDFRRYQSMGLSVCKVEEINIEQDRDILIAVLDMHLVDLIMEKLLQLGVHKESIYCIKVTDDVVQDILSCACLL